jgi:predicted nucleic-acid-binding Zn-ribbon protein
MVRHEGRERIEMGYVEDQLSVNFVCEKCNSQGGHVERLAMSGTGISRLLEIQPYRYAYVSCPNCGYTEIYNLKILEGKDDLGTFLEVLFSN